MKIIILNFKNQLSFDLAFCNWKEDTSQLSINEINPTERMMNFQALPDDEGGIQETVAILRDELKGIVFTISAEERIAIPLTL
jgi:hypothetical protein